MKERIFFCCVPCGKRLARDPAAAPEDKPSERDPSSCAECAGEVPLAHRAMAVLDGWSGLH